MITVHLHKQPIGYLRWTTVSGRHGNRHVGIEMRGIMDDYGTLVPIGKGAPNGD